MSASIYYPVAQPFIHPPAAATYPACGDFSPVPTAQPWIGRVFGAVAGLALKRWGSSVAHRAISGGNLVAKSAKLAVRSRMILSIKLRAAAAAGLSLGRLATVKVTLATAGPLRQGVL
ncbi:hypothetical protein AAFM46_10405 [Arthrobacter sp. TMP15]|uniref:hypothetical protein n=1 Tax=Arthrobacter sp. TMP15 TaxID=3140789 RepID=UPI0031BAE9AD